MGIVNSVANAAKQWSAWAKPVVFDATLGNAEVKRAVELLVSGEVGLEEALALAKQDEELFINLATASDGVPRASFTAWADENPTVVRVSLLGAALIAEAWHIRGGGYASTVAEDQGRSFLDVLNDAEATLWNATEIDPVSPLPWVHLVNTGRGLGLDLEEIRRRFDGAHERDPFNADAVNTMLQASCEKWMGSEQEMFEFARWVEANAPASSGARAVLPRAHLENMLGNLGKLSGPTDSVSVAELTAGLRSYLDALPEVISAAQLRVLNEYAAALEPQDKAAAIELRRCFDRIGDFPTHHPWHIARRGTGRFFSSVRARKLGVIASLGA